MARRRPSLLAPAAAALALWAAACGGGEERAGAPVPPTVTQALDGYAVVGGWRLHFKVQGEGDDALILLAGSGGHAFSFRHQMAPLSPGRKVYAVDLLGRGYSDRPPDGDYTVSGQARLVAGLMDALQIREAAVAGHSLGAAVALRLALDHPDRVDRLILIDPAVHAEGGRRAEDCGAFAGTAEGDVGRLLRETARDLLIASYHDDSLVTEDLLDGYLKPAQDLPAADLPVVVRGMLDEALGCSEAVPLEAVRQPVLMIWGREDEIVPLAGAAELTAGLPQAGLEVVEGAGHLPMEEKPDAVNDLILSFLASD